MSGYEHRGTRASQTRPATHTAEIDLATECRVEDVLAIVAYAEMRAVMLGWAGIPARDPRELARAAAIGAINEARSGTGDGSTLAARAIEQIRAETATALAQAGAKLGPFPWDRIIGRGQIGSLEGMERVFHDAGELASRHRAHDVRALAAAVSLTDALHARVRGHR
jgi:hypothetical protein